MHDMIHAAIANQRVRDFVETGEAGRMARDRKREQREQRKAEKPGRRAARPLGSGSTIAALLRLRRGAL
jgi:hypothetical protein